MRLKQFACTVAVVSSFATTSALAGIVSWTDWTAATTNQVTGSLTVGTTSVGVTFNGPYSLAQTSGGTNYWNPNTPYLSATVSNAPPASDIIELDAGSLKTITFSTAVHDPLIALVSWNGNVVNFAPGSNLQYLSSGCGYWGCGSFVSTTPTSFVGSGELHGVIELLGDFTSISFTDTTESWHGLTVGVVDLAPPPNGAPEPGSLALLGLGLAGLGFRRRKRAS